MSRSVDKRNQLWAADGPGFSSASDDWATPSHVFAALDAEFGFDLDVCASAGNAKCRRYYTLVDDGLSQTWTGRVWMNPPYGRAIGAWMAKAAASGHAGATVVCLVPARTDTTWWHEQVMAAASEVRFVRGRLKFGNGRNAAPFPSAIVVYRPNEHDLRVSAWVPPAADSMKPKRRASVASCPANVESQSKGRRS